MSKNIKLAISLLNDWFIRGSSRDFLEARNLILKEEQKLIKLLTEKADKKSRKDRR